MGKKRTQSGITNFFSKAGPLNSKISKSSENNDIKATEKEKNNDKEENIENTDTTNVQVEKCSQCAEKPENPFLICKHIDCPPASIGPQAAIGPQGPILPQRPIRPQEPVGAQGFPGRPQPDTVSQYCLNLARSDNNEVFQDIEQQNVETNEEHFSENETETD